MKKYIIQTVRFLSKPFFSKREIRAVTKLFSYKNQVYENYYMEIKDFD